MDWVRHCPELESARRLRAALASYLRGCMGGGAVNPRSIAELRNLVEELELGDDSSWRRVVRFHELLGMTTRMRVTSSFEELAESYAMQKKRPPPTIDAVVLTALRDPELKEVMRQPLVNMGEWAGFRITGDVQTYYWGKWGDSRSIRTIITASPDRMGMVPMAILATKAIEYWRPRFLVLCGIAAGLGNVKVGDILVPERIFVHDSGKVQDGPGGHGTTLLRDPWSKNLDAQLYDEIANRKTKFLQGIRESWLESGRAPLDIPGALNVWTEPVGVGDSVMNSEEAVRAILGVERKAAGVEMEGFSILSAASASTHTPYALVAKACSDDGKKKTDDYQTYAAYTSASFAKRFLLKTSIWDMNGQ